jgi:hypothetical protein
MAQSHHIEAVTVNHNTSRYMELMLRSLYATHSADLSLSLALYDNASQDDTAALVAFGQTRSILMEQSGFTTETLNNSHGEILRRFVLEHPDCGYYLFLDADVCFVQCDTIFTMMRELEEDPEAFAIGPRLSWDGRRDLPEEVHTKNPDIYSARLHPCCALVRNTEGFRRVVQEVGFSTVSVHWAERDEYLDTFKLMTKVMRTHGYHHLTSSAMVIHFFCASYEWDPEPMMEEKARRRDELLERLRRMGVDHSPR